MKCARLVKRVSVGKVCGLVLFSSVFSGESGRIIRVVQALTL